MPLVYKHGVYSEQQSSIVDPETTMNNLPAYIGTLPIQRVNANGSAPFDYTPYINKPILITSMGRCK